jgi:AcrR family transcriptional regulator
METAFEGPTTVSNGEPIPKPDGRRARRDRGRTSTIEAMIDLIMEGNTSPTVAQIAGRAGVSVASLFRYFDTLEDLRQTTSELYLERFDHVFQIPNLGKGSLKARIANLVNSRLSMHAAIEPMARLVRSRSYEHTDVAEMLHHVRLMRAKQVEKQFAPELAAMAPTVRAGMVAIITTLTSFESWDQSTQDHGRGPRQIRQAWGLAIASLLANE